MYNTPKEREDEKRDYVDFTKVNWRYVLPEFGIPVEHLSGHHCPCPHCGGKDRFRFSNVYESGTWICNHCGSGNGLKLIELCTGLGRQEIFAKLKELAADAVTTDIIHRHEFKPVTEFASEVVEKNRKRLDEVWSKGLKLTGSDPVSLYLERRVPLCNLQLLSNDIRCHPNLKYFERHPDGKYRSKGRFPCMLLRVTDESDKPISVHRTYLTPKGEKAPVGEVKKLMKGTRPLLGASIKINRVASRELSVCEGFETGLAIATAYGYRVNVWSLISAGNLANAAIPRDRFDHVTIYADKDPINPRTNKRPGEDAAHKLKEKLVAQGFTVTLKVPNIVNQDYADIWVDYCRMKHCKTA